MSEVTKLIEEANQLFSENDVDCILLYDKAYNMDKKVFALDVSNFSHYISALFNTSSDIIKIHEVCEEALQMYPNRP